MALGFLSGFTLPKIWKFRGYTCNPVIKKIRIPPVLGMIVIGCVARNFFGPFMDAYPIHWAQYIRNCCLGILLVRGGLEVKVRGQKLLVLFLSVVPQLFEATTIAMIGLGLFRMPIEVCFAMGYATAHVAPAIVVPQMMRLNKLGFGKSKEIAGSLIAAATFDNVLGVICFGICNTLTFDYADIDHGQARTQNIPLQIGLLILQNVVGLGLGVSFGLIAWVFKYIQVKWYCIYLKCLYCVLVTIALIIAGELSTFSNAPYIACLAFGHTCYHMWGERHKPTKEIAGCWFFIQPFLFGTIGAALILSNIRGQDIL